ncbi:hypothetical protein BASA62_000049 [Batrachochytrium salamandrivorans]|nr:hypothetical protein BASA62_000049 [Batrachochytrium salamandrivorans]
MCGILLVVQNSSAHSINENPVDSQLENTISSLCRANQRRGPDCYSSEKWSIPTHSDDSQVHVALHGWVLHLRGNTVTPQPFVDSHGNYTCFNGQIFGGIDVPLDTNDTHVLASCLAEEDSSEQHILNVLSRIRGEWAVVFYYKQTNTIYFGRDYLGRRSLLMHIPTHSSDAFLLSSVGPYFIKDDVKSSTDMTGYWTEVSTSGLFSINLSLVSDHWRDFETRITHIPWVRLNRFPADGDQLNLSLSEEKQQISSEDKHTEPRVAKLFCPSLMINTQLPLATDLPEIDEMDIRVCLPTFGPMTPISGAAKSLETALSEAVRLRTENIPIPTSGDARLGILFSGGLDCITLAALADRFIPKNEPIDLLNVGFENPRIAQHKVKIASKNQKRSGSNNASTDVSPVVLDDDAFNVPDRLTGRLGAAELCRLFPWREWRFVCINVPYAEAVEFRPLIISLMTPLYTAMDLSIARNIIQCLERQSKQIHWRIRQNYRHRRPDQPRPTAPPPPLSRQILAVNVANISNKRPTIRHIVRNTRIWAISETCITSSKFCFTVPGLDVIQHPATGPGRRGIALGIPSCFGGHEHGSAVGTMILAKVPNFTPECLWIVGSVYVGHSGATTNYSRREAFASIRQALDRVVSFDNNHPVLIFGDWNTDPQRLQRIVHS